MFQHILFDLWPWAAALVFVAGAIAALLRVLKWELRGGYSALLRRLHRHQAGGVQSVSFVMTAPLFIMLMLLAVQITQLMIGLMVVHYSAFVAARSATVWIPARMEPIEEVAENRIGTRTLVAVHPDGVEYLIQPGTPKYERIRTAAALGCVSVAPSRDLGLAAGDATTGSIQTLYATLAPAAMSNGRIPQRLANKWAYANAATAIEIRVFHRNDEPPLIVYPLNHRDGEFQPGEIGWRDQIRVTVTHNFALLPGPGRLLARRANETRYSDQISPQIRQQAGVYYIPLTATATMVGDGEKSVRPYLYAFD